MINKDKKIQYFKIEYYFQDGKNFMDIKILIFIIIFVYFLFKIVGIIMINIFQGIIYLYIYIVLL